MNNNEDKRLRVLGFTFLALATIIGTIGLVLILTRSNPLPSLSLDIGNGIFFLGLSFIFGVFGVCAIIAPYMRNLCP